uniref:Uncharacterized protein n=1 Tax=Solanum lycopersicum TaxID=4081 RepID=K4CDX0_SOLLC
MRIRKYKIDQVQHTTRQYMAEIEENQWRK